MSKAQNKPFSLPSLGGLLPRCMVFSEIRWLLCLPLMLWPKTSALMATLMYTRPELFSSLFSFTTTFTAAICVARVLEEIMDIMRIRLNVNSRMQPATTEDETEEYLLANRNESSAAYNKERFSGVFRSPGLRSRTSSWFSRDLDSSACGVQETIGKAGQLLAWDSFSDVEHDHETWQDGSVSSEELNLSEFSSEGCPQLETVQIVWPGSDVPGNQRGLSTFLNGLSKQDATLVED